MTTALTKRCLFLRQRFAGVFPERAAGLVFARRRFSGGRNSAATPCKRDATVWPTEAVAQFTIVVFALFLAPEGDSLLLTNSFHLKTRLFSPCKDLHGKAALFWNV